MSDEPKPPPRIDRTVRANRVLNRIADALGVPVSSLASPGETGSGGDRPGSEEAALLVLVQTYLERVDAEAQGRFLAAVQAMVTGREPPGAR